MNLKYLSLIAALLYGGSACAKGALANKEITRNVADVGSGLIMKCKGDKGSLQLYLTAVPTLAQGRLTSGGTEYLLNCKHVSEAPSNLNRLWNCTENRNSDGKMLVGIESGGFIGGVITAYVALEQAYPLHPKGLFTLTCALPSQH